MHCQQGRIYLWDFLFIPSFFYALAHKIHPFTGVLSPQSRCQLQETKNVALFLYFFFGSIHIYIYSFFFQFEINYLICQTSEMLAKFLRYDFDFFFVHFQNVWIVLNNYVSPPTWQVKRRSCHNSG